MYCYEIVFSGDVNIYAESEAEAMQKIRTWFAVSPGSLHLDGYNCIDIKKVENE